MTAAPSWFERHPRKTLFALLSAFLLVALALTEYVLEKELRRPPPTRYIRLKENAPLTNVTVKPDRKALERQYRLVVDSLEEKPYVFRTDENGFIMPSKVYADPQLTLVFLGGSTTECGFVDEESRFPYRAGVLLGRRLDKRVNSYNGGVRGSNSMHLIDVLINKVLPMKPDVVVFMENVNDVNIMLFSGSYWNDNPSRSLIVAGDAPRSRLRRLLRAAADDILPGIVHRIEKAVASGRSGDEFAMERRVRRVRSDVDYGEFEHNVATFVEICRARGILPVLMTQFNRLGDVPDEVTAKNMRQFEEDWSIGYASYKAFLEGFNAGVRKVAREKGVRLIDLEARVPKESRYMFDIVHLNTAGSELVANIIAEELGNSADIQDRLRGGGAAGVRTSKQRPPELETRTAANAVRGTEYRTSTTSRPSSGSRRED